MDKKGLLSVNLALFLSILLVAVFFVGGFFFFKSIRLTLVGIGMIVGSGILAVNIARSRSRNRGLTAFAFVLFFSGFFIIAAQGFGFLQTFAVTSISNVDVVNQGQRILVYASAVGGDELEITFSPETLNSYLRDDGYAATRTSRLGAEYIGSNKQIRFGTSEANSVKLINSTASGTYFGFSGTVQKCKDAGFIKAVAVMTDIPGRYKCFESYNNGNVNGFTGGYTGGFQIRFDLDGQTATLSDQSTSISLAGGAAKVSWVGNMLSIKDVNAPTAYDVFHVGSSWYLVDDEAFSTVSDSYQNFQSCVGTTVVSQSRFDSCRQSYYQVVSQQIDPKDQQFVRENSNIQNVNFNNGVMTVNLRQPTFIPTFTIELDAQKVGLVHLSGEPEIVECVDDQLFNSAGSRSANAVIKNKGNQAGLFEFSVSCDNPQISGSASPESFNAGQTRTIGIQVSGGNTGTNTNSGECTLTVRDRNSQRTDSCTFGVDVEYNSAIGACTGSETKCSPDRKTLFTCVNRVFQPTLCDSGSLCTVTNQNAQCIQQDGGGTGNGGGGSSGITREQCELKARENPFLGYTYVESSSQECGFLCRIGLAEQKTTITSKCTAESVPFFVLGFILASGIVTVLILIFRRPRRRRK